jgi:nitrous oxide reductase accessory protein NosL
MLPVRNPLCAAGLRLADGRTFYFCSNRCLLTAWRQPHRHLGANARIDRMVVLDYFSGKPLDGLTAWWIAGSDVIGPMGPVLVTLESEQDVKAFQRRHGGTQVFKPGQIDASLWNTIMPSDE